MVPGRLHAAPHGRLLPGLGVLRLDAVGAAAADDGDGDGGGGDGPRVGRRGHPAQHAGPAHSSQTGWWENTTECTE